MKPLNTYITEGILDQKKYSKTDALDILLWIKNNFNFEPNHKNEYDEVIDYLVKKKMLVVDTKSNSVILDFTKYDETAKDYVGRGHGDFVITAKVNNLTLIKKDKNEQIRLYLNKCDIKNLDMSGFKVCDTDTVDLYMTKIGNFDEIKAYITANYTSGLNFVRIDASTYKKCGVQAVCKDMLGEELKVGDKVYEPNCDMKNAARYGSKTGFKPILSTITKIGYNKVDTSNAKNRMGDTLLKYDKAIELKKPEDVKVGDIIMFVTDSSGNRGRLRFGPAIQVGGKKVAANCRQIGRISHKHMFYKEDIVVVDPKWVKKNNIKLDE